MADKNTIKNWFKTSLKPTQAQFWATWDSFWHKDEKIPITAIDYIENILNAKAEAEVLTDHLTTPTAHANLFNAKEDKTNKGAANGYVPLNSFIKISSQYLAIVDDLVTGGSSSLLSAEQGKLLQNQINGINTLLGSDNINLDTVQEIVDAIETMQTSLGTILVNDLTTGGTTKALTAEMGKQLDIIKENIANKSTSVITDYLSDIKFPSVKAVYDFCMAYFKKKFLGFADVLGITHTFALGAENTMFKFLNNNPIIATIPANDTTPFEIGTVFECIPLGNGVLSVTGGVGVTILTNLLSPAVKNEVRRYTKIDVNTWTVAGNQQISGTRVPRTYYVNGITGVNAKGVYEDSTRPYLTVDYVLTSANFKDGDIIFLETATTFALTAMIPVENFTIKSDVAATLTLSGNSNAVLSNIATGGTWQFLLPNGTLDLRSGTTKGYNNILMNVVINVATLRSNTTFSWTSIQSINMKVAGFYHDGGTFFAATRTNSSNNVFINSIISAAPSVLFGGWYHGYTLLEFDSISCSNSSTYYTLSSNFGNGARIYHGDVYCTSATEANFLTLGNATLKNEIIFKNKTTVTGLFSYHSTGGTVSVTGYCTFVNNTKMFTGDGSFATGNILFYNCTIFSKGPLYRDYGRGWVLATGNITFIDCTIHVDNKLIVGYNDILNNNQVITGTPAISFVGNNIIYCRVSPTNYITFNAGPGTYSGVVVERTGVLTTNGVIDPTITVNNLL
jgi:hypothetical protein